MATFSDLKYTKLVSGLVLPYKVSNAMLDKPIHRLSQYMTPAPNSHEHDIDTAVDIAALPKMRYDTPDPWTPPPYWQNLLMQDDKKFEIRGFRSIVLGFALFGVIVAIIFFWKIVAAVLAMRIILS